MRSYSNSILALLVATILFLATLPTSTVTASSNSIDLTTPNSEKATPTLRHGAAAYETIEWRYEEGQKGLSLLIQTEHIDPHTKTRSHLFTYPPEVTVAEVLRSRLPQVATKKAHVKCQFNPAVKSSVALGALLEKQDAAHPLTLTCGTTTFSFTLFKKPDLRPNEIRVRNKLRRSILGQNETYPLLAAELIGETWTGVWGWAENMLENHFGPLHPFLDYTTSTTQTGRWNLHTGEVLQAGATFDENEEEIRLALAADWGAGTLESDYVSRVMMNSNGTLWNPQWTLHVGDIYYVGSSDWVRSNCLGDTTVWPGVTNAVTWPHGSLGSFAVEGNHEMYARGMGFFNDFLPTLGVTNETTGEPSGQQAGFVSLENAYWRVIMLDTGYNSYGLIPLLDNRNNTQPQAVIDWLINVVDIGNESDTRGIIFLSHHQVESAFDLPFLATPLQIAELLPPNRTVVWLYGHEHRLAFYDLFTLPNSTNTLNIYGRCIGNSGFPSSVTAIPPRAKQSGLRVYDERVYELDTGLHPMQVGFNGFSRLTLQGPQAKLTYSSLTTDPVTGLLSDTLQTDLVEEIFQLDGYGNVDLVEFNILDANLTVIQSTEESGKTNEMLNKHNKQGNNRSNKHTILV